MREIMVHLYGLVWIIIKGGKVIALGSDSNKIWEFCSCSFDLWTIKCKQMMGLVYKKSVHGGKCCLQIEFCKNVGNCCT